MKVISIWQPFASLIVNGSKLFETRTWPAPKSVIGQTIGIASTKTIRPEQRAYFKDEEWLAFYERTNLPMDFESMPCGYLLGTATLDSVELMTEEFIDEVSVEEQAYGYWQEGFYAWRLTNVYRLPYPIPIRGAQGLYEWNGVLPDGSEAQIQAPSPAQVQKDHIKWTIKRGRSVIGATYELSNGDLVYLARRWRGEIFCCGEPTVSAAMAKGVEEWAFDHSHLLKLKFKGVKWVGVIEREKGGTLYLTTLETCMNKAYYQMRNYAKIGGELQHYINHRHFMKLTGTTTF